MTPAPHRGSVYYSGSGSTGRCNGGRTALQCPGRDEAFGVVHGLDLLADPPRSPAIEKSLCELLSRNQPLIASFRERSRRAYRSTSPMRTSIRHSTLNFRDLRGVGAPQRVTRPP